MKNVSSRRELSAGVALLWIASLAVLSVGAKNFEPGLTVDAPLYALLARNIVRTGDWFFLRGSFPGMIPFVEHPHLGLWAIAIVFKVLPPSDWAARLVGHVFYVGFLWTLFLFVRRKSGEATAVATILLLWIWFRFANFFSNVYLDPGTLFFGGLAIFAFDWALDNRPMRAGLGSGIALALCTMYKGMTVLGFLPALALLALRNYRRAWWAGAGLVVGATCVLVLYYLGIRQSEVPDFISLYFEKQWVHRFERQWNWSGLWDWSFWHPLFQDTYWLALLAPLAWRERSRELLLPTVLVLTFVAMFAPSGRDGAHYRLMILPWLAWLIAAGVVTNRRWPYRAIVKASAVFCVVAVLVLQYVPARTHGFRPPGEIDVIEKLRKEGRATQVIFDMAPQRFDFTLNDLYAWYTDLPIRYSAGEESVKAVEPKTAYVLYGNASAREQAVKAAGWCRYDRFGSNSLWLACEN